MPSSKPKDQIINVDQIKIVDLSDVEDKPGQIPKGTKVSRMAGQNIVTVEVPKEQSVNSFEPRTIKDRTGIRYSDIQAGIDDPHAVKNSRFRISDLTRGPLSVAEEEEQRIERAVQDRVNQTLSELTEVTRKSAYEEGFAVGKAEGHGKVLEESKPMLESFQQLIWEFESMKTEIFKANEEFVIRMIYRLAKTVLLRELKEDNDYTKRLVVQILDKLGTRENIKIFVGQQVYSAAEKLKADLAQSLGQLKNISIELATDIPHKGCRVETDFGEVDARIEVQIQNIANALGVSQV